MRSLLAIAIIVIGAVCLSAPRPTLAAEDPAQRATIDNDVSRTLAQLYQAVPGAQAEAGKAAGILVFPTVFKAGIGIGGEYGKGALQVGRRAAGYYSTSSASVGLQLGAQTRSMVIMFMTQDALSKFEDASGWDVGGDASVAVVKTGADGSIDTSTANQPVEVFVFGSTGLMGDLSLKGTKITKLDI